MREQVLNPASSNVNFTTRTISYDFDKAGRLTRETREERQTLRVGGEQSSTRITGYAYDEVSNRTSQQTNSYNGLGSAAQLVSTSSTAYNYNNADELTDETTATGTSSSTKTYGYDDNGAQISVASNGTTTPYKYDFEGKLVSVGDGTSSTRSVYNYDGDGNRLSSVVVNGTSVKTTQFLNDTNTAYVQVLEERDENGVLQARYDYGDGDLQKLSRLNKASNTYQSRWFLNDGLDSTRQLVDENGVVTDSYAYDAFGNTSDRSGGTENTRLYNGQQQDETNLYFLRARYMNTSTGRFLSHDPILGNSSDPVTLHRYLYCHNNPVDFVDPSGESDSVVDVSLANVLGTGLSNVWNVAVTQLLPRAVTKIGQIAVDLAWKLFVSTSMTAATGAIVVNSMVQSYEAEITRVWEAELTADAKDKGTGKIRYHYSRTTPKEFGPFLIGNRGGFPVSVTNAAGLGRAEARESFGTQGGLPRYIYAVYVSDEKTQLTYENLATNYHEGIFQWRVNPGTQLPVIAWFDMAEADGWIRT